MSGNTIIDDLFEVTRTDPRFRQAKDYLEFGYEEGRKAALAESGHKWMRDFHEMRDATIRELAAKGHSYARIGRELGLTRERVRQIAQQS